MTGPQVVKTKVRHDGTLSPASRQAALALHGLIANAEDPAVWTAQRMTVAEIVASQLRTAARFSEGEASLEEVLGTMLAAAAWIVAHHELTGGQH